MPTKEQIINNLREYSATEIAKAIKSGEVSLYELSKSGKLTPLMRKRIEEQMKLSDDFNEDIETEDSQAKNAGDDTNNFIAAGSQLSEIHEEGEETSSPAVVAAVASPTLEVTSEADDGDEVINNHGMFKRVFSFKGRIRRTEYGLSYICFALWYALFNYVASIPNDINPIIAIIVLISIVPAYWFLWAQGAKRCHDRGNSGWYQLIPFYVLWMFFGDSDEGINEYGTSPKE